MGWGGFRKIPYGRPATMNQKRSGGNFWSESTVVKGKRHCLKTIAYKSARSLAGLTVAVKINERAEEGKSGKLKNGTSSPAGKPSVRTAGS